MTKLNSFTTSETFDSGKLADEYIKSNDPKTSLASFVSLVSDYIKPADMMNALLNLPKFWEEAGVTVEEGSNDEPPTLYFDGDYENLYVGQALRIAKRALKPKHDWAWEDCCVYIQTIGENINWDRANNMEAEKEAKALILAARDIYNSFKRRMTAKVVADVIERAKTGGFTVGGY